MESIACHLNICFVFSARDAKFQPGKVDAETRCLSEVGIEVRSLGKIGVESKTR